MIPLNKDGCDGSQVHADSALSSIRCPIDPMIACQNPVAVSAEPVQMVIQAVELPTQRPRRTFRRLVDLVMELAVQEDCNITFSYGDGTSMIVKKPRK